MWFCVFAKADLACLDFRKGLTDINQDLDCKLENYAKPCSFSFPLRIAIFIWRVTCFIFVLPFTLFSFIFSNSFSPNCRLVTNLTTQNSSLFISCVRYTFSICFTFCCSLARTYNRFEWHVQKNMICPLFLLFEKFK